MPPSVAIMKNISFVVLFWYFDIFIYLFSNSTLFDIYLQALKCLPILIWSLRVTSEIHFCQKLCTRQPSANRMMHVSQEGDFLSEVRLLAALA